MKHNQEVLVSHESEEHALTRVTEFRYYYQFTCTDGMHVVRVVWPDGVNGSAIYTHAIPLPQAKPYTLETFPRGVVYLRYCESKFNLVVGIASTGVNFDGVFRTWLDLTKDYQISTDLGKTWRKCEDNGGEV